MKSNPRKKGKKPNAKKRGELAPLRLAEKLKQIRKNVPNLSQGKMLLFINPNETLEGNRARISQYEQGLRVPSLIELYNYAKFTGVPVEMLLDDAINLPAAIRNSLDVVEKPKEESARNENAEIGKAKSSNNADAIENGESENLSRQVFDIEDENSEKQTGLNIGEAPDDKDPNQKTSSDAEILPNATGGEESPLDDARFQESAAADVAADHSVVAAPVADDNSNHSAVVADPNAAIFAIRLSGEILNDSKTVYLESLGKLRFEEMGRFFTPQQFLEQVLAAAFADYRANGTASALARRLRL